MAFYHLGKPPFRGRRRRIISLILVAVCENHVFYDKNTQKVYKKCCFASSLCHFRAQLRGFSIFPSVFAHSYEDQGILPDAAPRLHEGGVVVFLRVFSMKNAILSLFQEMGGWDSADDPLFFPVFDGKKQLPPPPCAGKQAGRLVGGGEAVCGLAGWLVGWLAG